MALAPTPISILPEQYQQQNGSVPISAPPTTTNPSLPMGNDIPDIFDPNLTQDQINSLSAGDRQARAEYLGMTEEQRDATGAAFNTEITAIGQRQSTTTSAINQQDQTQFEVKPDWRIRLALSPDCNYLYRASPAGILEPLKSTDGVIFPYTPQIMINYTANYEPATITHSNYRFHQYSDSAIEQINITCDFTAQDAYEANYMLAVIHFFRSMTKMFYGQDLDPRPGTPPPLCYIFGMGGYQFAAHPMAITTFTYNLPKDVDYIMTTITGSGNSNSSVRAQPGTSGLAGMNLQPGGVATRPNFSSIPREEQTYVPSMIQISIGCIPIMSRNQISNEFSLRDYATGALLNGTRPGKLGGGMW